MVNGSRGVSATKEVTATAPTTLAWPRYGFDLSNRRYVDIDQINPSNVAQLKPAWVFHTTVMNDFTSFESQPIVVDGTLYVTSPHAHVFALDPTNGNLKWTYNPAGMPPINSLAFCCGQTNRGVVVGDGKVFVNRPDCVLVALDAKSGQVVWETPVADHREHYTETMTPQLHDGMVVIGSSGAEFMVRGFAAAYDADTGRQIWRFYTPAAPGEPGGDTWANESWRSGGGTVWSTPSIDPQLGHVYITTANPSPDLNGKDREGQNLFTCSIVALELKTGNYIWHFQEVHHDIWDYDAVQPSHLFDLTFDGQAIPAIGHAGRCGYYFILDRRTGTPVEQVCQVTEVPVSQEPAWQHAWPTQPESSIDLVPRSVERSTPLFPGLSAAPMWTPPHAEPVVMQPGFESGAEWCPAAYSPRTHYTYIPAGGYEPWIYSAPEQRTSTIGGNPIPLRGDFTPWGLMEAVDTTTGKIAWEYRSGHKTITGITVVGDLVFWGDSDGTFRCQEAESGKVLWEWKNPEGFAKVGGANGCPGVYVVNGQEYVVMAFGGNQQARLNSPNPTSALGDALIAFTLAQHAPAKVNEVTASPVQMPLSPLSETTFPEVSSLPSGVQQIELALDQHGNFTPDHIEARAGQQVAIHLRNTSTIEVPFTIRLPDQIINTRAPIQPGQEDWLVFPAPSQPGTYEFYDPTVTRRFAGIAGTLQVTS
jgi:PQQ-dependent dehydrogenase (methanol/ethanol family)